MTIHHSAAAAAAAWCTGMLLLLLLLPLLLLQLLLLLLLLLDVPPPAPSGQAGTHLFLGGAIPQREVGADGPVDQLASASANKKAATPDEVTPAHFPA
jgi:hypothetical protein